MPISAPTIPFPPYAPDLSTLGTAFCSVAQNVTPKSDGYGPFKSLETFTSALPDGNRGFFFARRGDGSIAVFAGTATRLYLLDNSTFLWTDISKGGSAYSSLVAGDNWQFAQFNDFVIAVQENTAPQKYVLASGGAFADLGGSPPFASHIAIIGFFVVLSGLLSNSKRVQWSDLDAPETWTAGVGLSDFEDLPDGGTVHGLSGGDAYGLIFQDEAIRSLIYAPGSPVVFQINRISTQENLFAQYSVINVGNRTFYCGSAGFKEVNAGGEPEPIGKDRVDQTFFADVDRSNLQLVIGASDPSSTRVYWAYKSQQGAAGLFDKILLYDWALKRWSLIVQSGQYIASLAKPGLTLEQLDAIAPGALTVTGAADNGAGLIRLTLNELANGPFDIHGQNFIVVQGVVGTTEANGSWHFTIIDATHIDLVGSAFSNAYVSGGAIGGSLDALPFSLDSVSLSSAAQLAAFDSDNKLGFFTGLNMEATVETGEQDGGGQMVFVSAFLPLTDCDSAAGSLGWRMNAQLAVAYTGETTVDETGQCYMNVEARYVRARVRNPAEAVWNYLRAVQPDFSVAGDR